MKKDKLWLRVIIFLAGCFCCYVTLQFSLFTINYELDVSAILLGLITIFVGLYIADVVQNNIIKRQNIYSILYSKIESSWQHFNSFNSSLKSASFLDLSETLIFFKQAELGIRSIKNYFVLNRIDLRNINQIESSLSNLDTFLDNLPILQNAVNISGSKTDISRLADAIDSLYIEILNEVNTL